MLPPAAMHLAACREYLALAAAARRARRLRRSRAVAWCLLALGLAANAIVPLWILWHWLNPLAR